MILELAEAASGWPLVVSLAAAVTAGGVRAGRRRSALNEALHELRRPLQALALAPTPMLETGSRDSSLQLASAALERLDREINGVVVVAPLKRLAARPLILAAIRRWEPRAALSGGSLSLRWDAGEAAVCGDAAALAQALDNLIVNAIDHGGPEIALEGNVDGGRLAVAVVDPGSGSPPRWRPQGPAGLLSWLSGRRRHGHGLRVVRRAAAAHGGEFRIGVSVEGTRAVLELPLIDAAEGA